MANATSKTLFQLCYPLFFNAFMALAVTLIDTIIISNYSDDAAAAVSIANQVLGVAYDFSALLGVGGVILISRSLGQGCEARARSIAAVTIVANAALSLLIALVLLVTGPILVKLINTPAKIVDDAVLYIKVIAVAMTFNGFLMAAVSVLRAFAKVKTILVLGIFANVLYIVLEYVLIYGYGPIPELGVFGSALATLSVRVSGVLLLMWVLARHLQLRYRSGMSLKRLAPLVKRLFNLSYPSVMDNVAYGFYQLFLVSFIAGLGVPTVLSRSYTLTLTAFLTLIMMTISQGNEVLVGYLFGAGRRDDVYWRAMRSAGITVVLTTSISGLFYLFSTPLISLFTDDPEIHRMANQLLFLTIFLQPVTVMNTILFHALKVTGDVYVPVVASQLVMWLVGFPLAYVVCIPLGQGVIGLWYVFIFEESLKAAFMFYRWSGGRRRTGVVEQPIV
jgi:putative MATE family efflux protein